VVDFTAVTSAADAACYKAKHGGRNNVYVYSEDDWSATDNDAGENWLPKLEQAIRSDGFVVHLQPIVSAQSGQLAPTGLHECFVRMKDPDDDTNLYYPAHFMKSAQRFGLAADIDRRVITSTFEFIAALPQSYAAQCFSINLSAASIEQEDFMGFLENQLLRHSISGSRLCFELTEETVLNNFDAAKTAIKKLRMRGCKVALDDFGAGVSALATLRGLKIDFLKIDGQFTMHVDRSSADECLVRSINRFAKEMGFRTIAEKVESQSACDLLVEIGVDYIQGYVAGRPEPMSNYFRYADAA
jgi:Amt family ammonium transporter